MGVKIKVEGLRELERALNELSVSQSKGVLRRVGRKALEPFDQAWRSKAPVHDGDLRTSGGVGSNLTKRERRRHKRESTVEVFAGPGGDPVPAQQEFGNERHGAQPFMRPAWDETKDQALEIVAKELGGEIEKAAQRAARRAAKRALK
jgi:HK97 gp10 family phage protein